MRYSLGCWFCESWGIVVFDGKVGAAGEAPAVGRQGKHSTSTYKDLASYIINRGERVKLPLWLTSDVEQFIYWLSYGEWRLIDAPWHGYRTVTTAEQEKRDREWFTQKINGGEETVLNRSVVFATTDNIPIISVF